VRMQTMLLFRLNDHGFESISNQMRLTDACFSRHFPYARVGISN
jgi:hypothetical protein